MMGHSKLNISEVGRKLKNIQYCKKNLNEESIICFIGKIENTNKILTNVSSRCWKSQWTLQRHKGITEERLDFLNNMYISMYLHLQSAFL